MTLSFWRYSHLALAIFSSLFLIIASLTGVVLAIDGILEKNPTYQVANFEKITLGEILPTLKKNYPEITELSVNHNQYVTLQAIDKNGSDVNAYIDPRNGAVLGKPIPKNQFIHWTIALHRSLFLKETGRFFVGFISFLLTLIAISGLVLVLKRQQHISRFFSKIVKENFAQYYHIYLGRLSLIPILIIALTGAYLTLEKFHFFIPQTNSEREADLVKPISKDTYCLKEIILADVQKIEFPFSEDPEDYYTIKLKDKEIEVNQFTGDVISESKASMTTQLSHLSLDLHTGRTSILWAIILIIACLNILFFIYSGFSMTLKRRESRIKNKFSARDSTYILLVGSENGSTLRFANSIYKQLILQGHKVHITELNQYNIFPKAEHLIIFTATYGFGDAPPNATKFIDLLNKTNQTQKIRFSVVGFGSKHYPHFCGYALQVNDALLQQNWAEPLLELRTVNNKSVEEFIVWAQLWSAKTAISLSLTPSIYSAIPSGLQKLKVLDKTFISETEQSFLLTLGASKSRKFNSGDLLAIYPKSDYQERLYSIGKIRTSIQLVIKLHPSGLGSNYLYNLEVGEIIKARIIKNSSFYFPKKSKQVALISNGTGIAPFLGMIEKNKKKTEIHLYCGFRKTTETVLSYEKFASEMILKKQLDSFHLALSREAEHFYVMDLIQRDATFFNNLLAQGGVIMICGSLAMQKDVESVLNQISLTNTRMTITDYKNNAQILTDCY